MMDSRGKGKFIMLMTSNLLTAFMLGGWIAVTPVILSGDPASATASNLQTEKVSPYASGQRTASGKRYGGGHYANLNQ